MSVIQALRRDGHDVVRAIDVSLAGTDDQAHLDSAVGEQRILLTQDADFLALSSRLLSDGGHHPGVIYWPQGKYGVGEVIRRLRQFLETTPPEGIRDLVKFL